MKIGGLQPFSLSDYPGHSAAIIFTIGCNFRCHYCHNKNLWNEYYQQISEENVLNFLTAKVGLLDGVVITGGEPTIHSDLIEFIKKIRKLKFKIKLNTNGANCEIFGELLNKKLLDYVAMDIKSPWKLYAKLSGVRCAVAAVKKSIELVTASGVAHEFRTLWDNKWLQLEDIAAIKKIIPPNSKYIVSKQNL